MSMNNIGEGNHVPSLLMAAIQPEPTAQTELESKLAWRVDALLSECRAQREQIARLREALADTELRCTQARLASSICKKSNRTEFLLGEIGRIAEQARAALNGTP